MLATASSDIWRRRVRPCRPALMVSRVRSPITSQPRQRPFGHRCARRHGMNVQLSPQSLSRKCASAGPWRLDLSDPCSGSYRQRPLGLDRISRARRDAEPNDPRQARVPQRSRRRMCCPTTITATRAGTTGGEGGAVRRAGRDMPERVPDRLVPGSARRRDAGCDQSCRDAVPPFLASRRVERAAQRPAHAARAGSARGRRARPPAPTHRGPRPRWRCPRRRVDSTSHGSRTARPGSTRHRAHGAPLPAVSVQASCQALASGSIRPRHEATTSGSLATFASTRRPPRN